jgi:ATP/maltotriose-dependent transcriptional regulator MalT
VPELDSAARVVERRELRVTAEASEMVTVPRAELDALRAEVRRLRREVGRSMALARIIEADPGPGDGTLTMSRSELAEAWGIGE